MGLALLPFFQFFRGTPHQLAAIKQLEESMPAELLEENEADWFQAWKESGYDQQIYMPYFTQLDNKTGTGYRECFSSAAAMVAAFYKKVTTDDQYNDIRNKYGDTTSVEAQLAALRSLGLKAEFRKDGDADLVEREPDGLGRLMQVSPTLHEELEIERSVRGSSELPRRRSFENALRCVSQTAIPPIATSKPSCRQNRGTRRKDCHLGLALLPCQP